VNRVEWSAVRVGAAVAVVICMPLALVADAIVDERDADPSALAGVFYVLVLLGFAVGGLVAARRAVDTPYSSGAIAALAGFAVIAAISIVSHALRDEEIKVIGIVSNGLLAYGAGLLGAALVARRRSA
jgi:putative membrane protein (TIGR04086 family)